MSVGVALQSQLAIRGVHDEAVGRKVVGRAMMRVANRGTVVQQFQVGRGIGGFQGDHVDDGI